MNKEKCKNNFYHQGWYQMTDSPVYCPTCGKRVNGDGEKAKWLSKYHQMSAQQE